jgi:hypothetical protein
MLGFGPGDPDVGKKMVVQKGKGSAHPVNGQCRTKPAQKAGLAGQGGPVVGHGEYGHGRDLSICCCDEAIGLHHDA